MVSRGGLPGPGDQCKIPAQDRELRRGLETPSDTIPGQSRAFGFQELKSNFSLQLKKETVARLLTMGNEQNYEHNVNTCFSRTMPIFVLQHGSRARLRHLGTYCSSCFIFHRSNLNQMRQVVLKPCHAHEHSHTLLSCLHYLSGSQLFICEVFEKQLLH